VLYVIEHEPLDLDSEPAGDRVLSHRGIRVASHGCDP